MARNAALLAAAVALLAGCGHAKQTASKTDAEAKNAISPIVGSWTINGDVPPPQANLPQFVRLKFSAGGKLDASYVAAGGALAKVINTPSKLKSERDSYTLDENQHVSIVEGSRSLDYTWHVTDGKLFLTAKGADEATVYQGAGS